MTIVLTVDVLREPARTLVVLAGELDLSTGRLLADALAGTADDHRVDVDLSRLSQCDSCGLNILLAARHRAWREGRELRVVGVGGLFARVTGACDASRVLLGA
jgi:anti-anti-sigma factor